MKKLLSFVLLFVLASPAYAWNDKGRMVVACLAWIRFSRSALALIELLVVRAMIAVLIGLNSASHKYFEAAPVDL
jgi:hypothetical protein